MNVVASVFLLVGCAFLLLAALGIVRMPDLYTRMSSSSKAVTLGVGCLAIGLSIHMSDTGVLTRSILLIVLFLMKAPVAAHMLGRAAYLTGTPLWEATLADELEGKTMRPAPPRGGPPKHGSPASDEGPAEADADDL